jgi:hypothetical protein
MPEFLVRHELDCDEDTFWHGCTFNEEFNQALYRDTLKFPRYEGENVDRGETITRHVHVDPPITGMPGPVKKVLGDRFGYVEEGTFVKATKRYTFKVTPSTMPEKTSTVGELWCEKLGEKKIARFAKITVSVKVFAIGGMIEEKIMSDLRASYDSAAKFANEWVKRAK